MLDMRMSDITDRQIIRQPTGKQAQLCNVSIDRCRLTIRALKINIAFDGITRQSITIDDVEGCSFSLEAHAGENTISNLPVGTDTLTDSFAIFGVIDVPDLTDFVDSHCWTWQKVGKNSKLLVITWWS